MAAAKGHGGGTSRENIRINQGALDKAGAQVSHMISKVYGHMDPKTVLEAVGLEVVSNVKRLLSQPGGGRTYTRRGITHRASAPGQPPAVDTGRLRSSYTHVFGETERGPYVEIGTNVKYAPYLEYGTRNMAARPHLKPGVEQLAARIGVMVADKIADRLRQAAK